MRSVRIFAAIAFFSCLAQDAEAEEQARLVFVREAAATDCPNEAALKDAVAARMGYSPFFPLATSLVSVDLRRESNQYIARVRTVEEGKVVGTRELSDTSCVELLRTVALSLSLAIDPKAVERVERGEAPSTTAPSSDLSPIQGAEPNPATRPSRTAPPPAQAALRAVPERVATEASLALGGSAGTSPSPTVGAVGELRARYASWSFGAGAKVDVPSSKETASGARIAAGVIGASLAPCFHRSGFAVCAVVLAGVYRASATQIAVPGSDAELHVAVGPRLRWTLPVAPRVALFAHAELLGDLTPHVSYVDEVAVHRAGRAAVNAAIGVTVRLW